MKIDKLKSRSSEFEEWQQSGLVIGIRDTTVVSVNYPHLSNQDRESSDLARIGLVTDQFSFHI